MEHVIGAFMYHVNAGRQALKWPPASSSPSTMSRTHVRISMAGPDQEAAVLPLLQLPPGVMANMPLSWWARAQMRSVCRGLRDVVDAHLLPDTLTCCLELSQQHTTVNSSKMLQRGAASCRALVLILQCEQPWQGAADEIPALIQQLGEATGHGMLWVAVCGPSANTLPTPSLMTSHFHSVAQLPAAALEVRGSWRRRGCMGCCAGTAAWDPAGPQGVLLWQCDQCDDVIK